MSRGNSFRSVRWLLGIPLVAVGAAYGQLSDGNFDALAVGTPPDCGTPAGAWQFPANYVTAAACEVTPTDYTIVATSSFQTGASGNSLAVVTNNATANMHLTNILGSPIVPAAGQTVRVNYDLWVGAVGDGATLYVGADMGGGGLSNATDRGPQISWLEGGTIAYNVGGVLTTVFTGYQRQAWQHVRLDIHLDTSLYDFFYTPPGGVEQTLGTGLHFRVPSTAIITRIDRISIAHFGGTVGLQNSDAFYDNFTIALLSACYPNCDASTSLPCLNVQDFSCFLNKFAAGDPYANCDGSTTPPVLNVQDFACFLNSFAAGCSGC